MSQCTDGGTCSLLWDLIRAVTVISGLRHYHNILGTTRGCLSEPLVANQAACLSLVHSQLYCGHVCLYLRIMCMLIACL